MRWSGQVLQPVPIDGLSMVGIIHLLPEISGGPISDSPHVSDTVKAVTLSPTVGFKPLGLPHFWIRPAPSQSRTWVFPNASERTLSCDSQLFTFQRSQTSAAAGPFGRPLKWRERSIHDRPLQSSNQSCSLTRFFQNSSSSPHLRALPFPPFPPHPPASPLPHPHPHPSHLPHYPHFHLLPPASTPQNPLPFAPTPHHTTSPPATAPTKHQTLTPPRPRPPAPTALDASRNVAPVVFTSSTTTTSSASSAPA